MMVHNVKILGFGDNVVDQYEHIKTMYPGGNCVNLCAYAMMFGVEKSAYMGYSVSYTHLTLPTTSRV